MKLLLMSGGKIKWNALWRNQFPIDWEYWILVVHMKKKVLFDIMREHVWTLFYFYSCNDWKKNLLFSQLNLVAPTTLQTEVWKLCIRQSYNSFWVFMIFERCHFRIERFIRNLFCVIDSPLLFWKISPKFIDWEEFFEQIFEYL